MKSTKKLAFVLTLALWFSLPVSAQWLTPVPPKDGHTAAHTAGVAPLSSALVFAWNLEGQYDYKGVVPKLRRVMSHHQDRYGKDPVASLERKLKRPLSEFVDYFTGSGFVAMDAVDPNRPDPQILIGLGLKRPGDFARWAQEVDPEVRIVSQRGIQLIGEDDEDIAIGFDSNWFFVSLGADPTERALNHFTGETPALNRDLKFRSAFKSLGYKDSGAALYMNVEKVQNNAIKAVGLAGDFTELQPWEYGAGVIDFRKEVGDFFFKLTPGDGPVHQALKTPGRVGRAEVAKVPRDLTSYMIMDGIWYAKSLNSMAEAHPSLGMIWGLAQGMMGEYGNIAEALGGTTYVASDVFDCLHPGSEIPTVVVGAELKNPQEAHKIVSKAVGAEGTELPSQGLIYKPESPYSLRIDPAHRQLRFAAGTRKDEFIKRAPENQRRSDRLVKKVLNWSQDRSVVLGFFNLEPILQHWRKNADVSDKDQALAKAFVEEFLSGQDSQGVIAVKTSSEGLHYRLRGMATSPLVPAIGVGAGFVVGRAADYKAKSEGLRKRP